MAVRYIEADALASILLANDAGVAVVDVRDDDFAGGHIKGAVNIPSHNFSDDNAVDQLVNGDLAGKDRAVVHCMFSQQRGPRSAIKLAQRLQDTGRTDVSVLVLRGGFRRFAAMYGSNPLLCEDMDPAAW